MSITEIVANTAEADWKISFILGIKVLSTFKANICNPSCDEFMS